MQVISGKDSFFIWSNIEWLVPWWCCSSPHRRRTSGVLVVRLKTSLNSVPSRVPQGRSEVISDFYRKKTRTADKNRHQTSYSIGFQMLLTWPTQVYNESQPWGDRFVLWWFVCLCSYDCFFFFFFGARNFSGKVNPPWCGVCASGGRRPALVFTANGAKDTFDGESGEILFLSTGPKHWNLRTEPNMGLLLTACSLTGPFIT